jgi:glycosylphosphatidylinositol transamidase (GPIT) subunit GPI8
LVSTFNEQVYSRTLKVNESLIIERIDPIVIKDFFGEDQNLRLIEYTQVASLLGLNER